MLLGWVWDLHPPGAANCWMGNISIAANFITCINYDDTFVKVICEHSCHLPNDGRLAYPCLDSALLRASLKWINAKRVYKGRQSAHLAFQ